MTKYVIRAAICVAAFVAAAEPSVAAPRTTSEQCSALRFKALGRYQFCLSRETLKREFQWALSPCGLKYARDWLKLQDRFAGSGTECSSARFHTEGDTVRDAFSGLVWEKKLALDGIQNYADRRDSDNTYTLSSPGTGVDSDGTAYTDILARANTPPCLANQCDWRIPTPIEAGTLIDGSSCPGCISPIEPGGSGFGYWLGFQRATAPLDYGFVGAAGGLIGIGPRTMSQGVILVRGGLIGEPH